MQKISLYILIMLIPIISLSQGDDWYQKYSNRDYNFLRISETTPSVAEFQAMKHFEAPKCNGKLNVSLPLYNIQHKSTNVPIYLGYNTAGIKVNGVASRVGQNWHLTAGGKITRTQKGAALDDEDETEGVVFKTYIKGWQNHEQTIGLDAPYNADHAYIYDLEPDVFFLTAPGLTTEFIINKEGKAVEVKGDDIKLVNSPYSPSGGTFEVLSATGVRYYFNKTSTTVSYSAEMGYTYPIQDWHLTTLIYPTGERVDFEYDDLGFDQRDFRQLYNTHGIALYDTPSEDYIPIVSDSDDRSVRLTSLTRLKKITFGSGTVEFTYGHARLDIAGDDALSNITIKNYNDEDVKSIDLNYGYLNNSSGAESRLMLSEIIFKGSLGGEHKTYSFDYNTDSNNSTGLDYFPSFNSKSYDCFGYFANNGQTSDDVKIYAYVPTDVTQTVYYPFSLGTVSGYDVTTFTGDNRTPVESHAKTGMLWRINYPTGGYMELEYESNQLEILGQTINGAGLRIKKQALKGTDIDWEKTYIYEQPVVKLPRFANLAAHESLMAGSTSTDRINFVNAYTVRYETNQVNLDLLDGSPVLYEKVTETQTGNGKVVYYFNIQQDTQPNTTFTYDNGISPKDYLEYNPVSDWPFWSGRSYSGNRGKVEEIHIYDESGDLIQAEIYNYSSQKYDLEGINTVTSRYYKEWKEKATDPEKAVVSASYWIVPSKTVLNNKQIIKIPDGITLSESRLESQLSADPTLEGQLLIQEEVFDYNDFNQLMFHYYYESDGTRFGNIYRYASDYLGFNGESVAQEYYNSTEEELLVLNNMLENDYMVGVPIETIARKQVGSDRYLIGGGLNKYTRIYNSDIGHWMSLNSKNYTYNISSPQLLQLDPQDEGLDISLVNVEYNSSTDKYYLSESSNHELLKEFEYNDNGNLITANYADDVKVSYEWGYNNSLPIAKVTNANWDEIAYTSFESGTGNESWESSSGTLQTDSKTGEKSMEASTISTSNTIPAGEYKLSMWAKKSGTGGSITVNGQSIDSFLPGNGSWNFGERTINLSSAQKVVLTITEGILVDEIRLLPVDAQMTAYTYEPLGGMTSKTGPDNNPITYMYDEFDRLILVKDHMDYVSSKYDYSIKGNTSGSSGGGSGSTEYTSQRIYEVEYAERGIWCTRYDSYDGRCEEEWVFNLGVLYTDWKLTNTQTGDVLLAEGYGWILDTYSLEDISAEIANAAENDFVRNISGETGFENVKIWYDENKIIIKQLDENLHTDMSVFTLEMIANHEDPNDDVCTPPNCDLLDGPTVYFRHVEDVVSTY